MRCLVLISLAAVASCAPVGEQESYIEGADAGSIRVKKAKEIITYGNEQNLPSIDKEKRSDPALNTENSNIDEQGEVKALDPVDLTAIADKVSDMNMEHGDTDSADDSADDTATDLDQQILQTLSEHNMDHQQASDESNTATGDNSVEETSDVSSAEEPENGANDVVDDEQTGSKEKDTETDDADYINYLEKINGNDQYLNPYMQLMGWPKGYYNGGQTPYRYNTRYRRSQVRALNGRPLMKRAAKRSRRMKRDLFYPAADIDEEYAPYVDASYFDSPYDAYPSGGASPTPREDDYSYLLDLLDDAQNEAAYEAPYGGYDAYEYVPDEAEYYQQEYPTNYVQKRQGAGLQYVPGIKRNRDWYPYFEEPQTHFSAFVPKKRGIRDYAQEYGRVMELAAALRAQNAYEDSYNGVYGYRRRK